MIQVSASWADAGLPAWRAGGRNSTPGLNGIQEISGSAIAAVAYPVPYALTAALMLILGYIAMVFS